MCKSLHLDLVQVLSNLSLKFETLPFGMWQQNRFELLVGIGHRFLPGIDHLLNLYSPQKQRAQPAASQEMGLLFRRGIEGPGGAGPVPKIPGVRIQFRKPQVTLSK